MEYKIHADGRTKQRKRAVFFAAKVGIEARPSQLAVDASRTPPCVTVAGHGMRVSCPTALQELEDGGYWLAIFAKINETMVTGSSNCLL